MIGAFIKLEFKFKNNSLFLDMIQQKNNTFIFYSRLIIFWRKKVLIGQTLVGTTFMTVALSLISKAIDK
jgi:hypothetical protein